MRRPHKKKRANLHRSVVFMQMRDDNQRSTGPYRPRRLPSPSKRKNLGAFLIACFLLILIFSFAHIWKAHAVTQICSRLDALRNRQQDLREKLKAQELIFEEATLYSRIELLARERLGMYPAATKPVVIAPLHERIGAVQNATDRNLSEKRP